MHNKLIISIIIALFTNQLLSNNGGAIAAGVLGGFGAGALLASAASKNRSRDVVYVNDSRPYYGSTISSIRLEQWEQDLLNREADLNEWEQNLKRRERKLRRFNGSQGQYI